MDELIDALSHRLDVVIDDPGESAPPEDRDAPIAVAIVGRPNVGKSSLVNVLVGEDRSIVGETPGTTRDAVDTLIDTPSGRFLLIDTAGLRRRGRVTRTAESLAVTMARRAMRRADVVILVLDATQPLAAQDTHIAGLAHDALRPIVVAVNKWDLVDAREGAAKVWSATVLDRLRFMKETPVVFVSALSGLRAAKILDRAASAHACAGIRIATPDLNRWLRTASGQDAPRPSGGPGLRLLYAVQTGVHPQRFTFFCNDARRVHFSARRRLENGLRERFGLGCAPMKIAFRGRREARS